MNVERVEIQGDGIKRIFEPPRCAKILLVIGTSVVIAICVSLIYAWYSWGEDATAQVSPQRVSSERAHEIFTTVLPGDIVVLNSDDTNEVMITYRDDGDHIILGRIFRTPPSIGWNERYLLHFKEVFVIKMDDPGYDMKLESEARRYFKQAREAELKAREQTTPRRLPI